MKAFAIEEFGRSGSVQELPAPDPLEGQVRIRVAVAGVNPFDNAVIQGYVKDVMEHRFPLVPGMDASGVVEAIGPGVTEWAVGDGVFGACGKMVLGATDVIDYSSGDVVEAIRSRYPDGVDALADMHGDKDLIAGLAEQVRSGGHMISAVGAADPEALALRGIEASNIQGRVTTES